MVALWLIGYEDEPDRSGEICVCEIFGRDAAPNPSTTSADIGESSRALGKPRERTLLRTCAGAQEQAMRATHEAFIVQALEALRAR